MIVHHPRIEASNESVRVLVVDDHSLVAETVVYVLTTMKGFKVDYASDVNKAADFIESTGRYDAILLDYDIPGTNALEGLRRLLSLNNGAVVIFSGIISRIMVDQALNEGAAGFIPKTLPLKILSHAILFVANGEIYLPADYMRNNGDRSESTLELKPRELKVLTYLCAGMPNKEIGRELRLPEVIVKLDVKSICKKLGVKNRTQAVIAARKFGIF
jgi:two-component system, NarL family, nitrate/nitrite response regulator NarL